MTPLPEHEAVAVTLAVWRERALAAEARVRELLDEIARLQERRP